MEKLHGHDLFEVDLFHPKDAAHASTADQFQYVISIVNDFVYIGGGELFFAGDADALFFDELLPVQAAELDLVDVAYAFQLDAIEQVKTWTESRQVSPVNDDQAKLWVASDALLWAVVIKPWVLVQTITDS